MAAKFYFVPLGPCDGHGFRCAGSGARPDVYLVLVDPDPTKIIKPYAILS